MQLSFYVAIPEAKLSLLKHFDFIACYVSYFLFLCQPKRPFFHILTLSCLNYLDHASNARQVFIM